jgi:hypothetical protein
MRLNATADAANKICKFSSSFSNNIITTMLMIIMNIEYFHVGVDFLLLQRSASESFRCSLVMDDKKAYCVIEFKDC